jgi:hypothetical protein
VGGSIIKYFINANKEHQYTLKLQYLLHILI